MIYLNLLIKCETDTSYGAATRQQSTNFKFLDLFSRSRETRYFLASDTSPLLMPTREMPKSDVGATAGRSKQKATSTDLIASSDG